MSSIKDNLEDKKDEISKEISDKTESISNSIDSGIKKTKRFFRKVLLFSLLAAFIGGGLYLLWSNWTYSEGSRTGYLMKLSKKGYVFKTYEGQLNLGGFQESDNTSIVGNVWEFSLQDEALVKRLEELEGKKVSLKYKEINKSMPWQGDTKYFIIGVEEK